MSHTEFRICQHAGYLVDARHRMGDEYEFQPPRMLGLIGCSKLRCPVCASPVLNAVGYELKGGVTPVAAYWSKSDGPSTEHTEASTPHVRIYCCMCTAHLETSYTAVYPPPPHDVFERIFPWRCQGHSELRLHSRGQNQLDRAKALLYQPISQKHRSYLEAEDLRIMWLGADVELQRHLSALFLEVLYQETGLALARSLGVVAFTPPDAFQNILATLDPKDERWAKTDETRTGWSLRDRLGHTIAQYAHRFDAVPRLREMAHELLPDTKSKELIRVTNQLSTQV